MAQQLTHGVRVDTVFGPATVIEAAPTQMASGEVIKVRYDRPGVTVTGEGNEDITKLEVLSGPTCMATGCVARSTRHIRWTEFFQPKTATACTEHVVKMLSELKYEKDLSPSEVEVVEMVPETVTPAPTPATRCNYQLTGLDRCTKPAEFTVSWVDWAYTGHTERGCHEHIGFVTAEAIEHEGNPTHDVKVAKA